MNEYNHHRIIERVAHSIGLDPSKKETLIKASDFSDFFIGFLDTEKSWRTWLETAKQKYFFYHFYYSINIEIRNTIRLNRVTSNAFFGGSNNSINCMECAGEKELDGKYSLEGWSKKNNEKEFFSSVNDREYSPQSDWGDTANQSDNVAFLHAMGSEGETAGDTGQTTEGEGKTSRSIFEDHLKKCFAEYLFLKDEEEALFMLGIAFHGIMDSFTPSHMGFQKYTKQDMGLHAQGDVIPILNNKLQEEEINFDPGQFKHEIPRNQFICVTKKHYNGSDFINPIEYKMLQIFLIIGDIQHKIEDKWEVADNNTLWNNLKGLRVSQINQELGNRQKYRYGPKSYAYSEAAIKVISDIFNYLCDNRELCKSYSSYKEIKDSILDTAISYWSKVYDGYTPVDYIVKYCKTKTIDGSKVITPIGEEKVCLSMKNIREEHIKHALYFKNLEYEQQYIEWKVQQNIDGNVDIDRLNRLKG